MDVDYSFNSSDFSFNAELHGYDGAELLECPAPYFVQGDVSLRSEGV